MKFKVINGEVFYYLDKPIVHILRQYLNAMLKAQEEK